MSESRSNDLAEVKWENLDKMKGNTRLNRLWDERWFEEASVLALILEQSLTAHKHLAGVYFSDKALGLP